jgi:site-specific recombinase XerD
MSDPVLSCDTGRLSQLSPAIYVSPDQALIKTRRRRDTYRSKARSDNTKRAYESDWSHFVSWCADRSLAALPADDETVSLYLSDLAEAGFKASTIGRRVSSISVAHKTAGLASPCNSAGVRFTFAGIKRVHGSEQIGKAPTLLEDLKLMLRKLKPNRLQDVRDRALLLVGFAAALRRSELVGIDVEDLELTREGYVLRIRRSKGDQEGRGERVGIPRGKHPDTCPVRALQAWLEASGRPSSGPLFRNINRWGQIGGRLSGYAVALIIQRRARAAGLDPERFGGHSLRAGFATQAIRSGVSEIRAMRQTRHKSSSVFRRYVREAELFDGELAKLGL